MKEQTVLNISITIVFEKFLASIDFNIYCNFCMFLLSFQQFYFFFLLPMFWRAKWNLNIVWNISDCSLFSNMNIGTEPMTNILYPPYNLKRKIFFLFKNLFCIRICYKCLWTFFRPIFVVILIFFDKSQQRSACTILCSLLFSISLLNVFWQSGKKRKTCDETKKNNGKMHTHNNSNRIKVVRPLKLVILSFALHENHIIYDFVFGFGFNFIGKAHLFDFLKKAFIVCLFSFFPPPPFSLSLFWSE